MTTGHQPRSTASSQPSSGLRHPPGRGISVRPEARAGDRAAPSSGHNQRCTPYEPVATELLPAGRLGDSAPGIELGLLGSRSESTAPTAVKPVAHQKACSKPTLRP